MKRPNIIYFHTHDTGCYISPYGYAVPTPNYQRLAESGMTFKHMHSIAPTCSPSRAGLLTGQYPHQSGMVNLAHHGGHLHDVKKHIIHTLQPAGYHTTLLGFHHVINWPEYSKIGYDETIKAGTGFKAGEIADEAAAFLHRRRNLEQPFFISIGLTETHRVFPSEVPEGSERYLRPPAPFPDTEVFRKDMAAYVESLKAADAALGTVLDTLESTGLADNTLIICTTDHGLPFPSMKNNLTDHGTAVLYLMSGPNIPKGAVTDALSTHLDVFPTVCQYSGIDAPDWLEGKSLLPVIEDPKTEIHDAIFTHSNYHGKNYAPLRCVRDGRYAYIQGFEETEHTQFPTSDASPSEDAWKAHNWGSKLHPKERLFDCLFDPHEMNNLAGDPSYQDIKRRLQDQLNAHLNATSDPITKGPITPVHAGA